MVVELAWRFVVVEVVVEETGAGQVAESCGVVVVLLVDAASEQVQMQMHHPLGMCPHAHFALRQSARALGARLC